MKKMHCTPKRQPSSEERITQSLGGRESGSESKEEIENIRYALQRGRPYGSEKWVSKTVAEFGLESTLTFVTPDTLLSHPLV